MKILHINSYYSAGIFYKNLYDRQVENGLDIAVYVPVPSSVDPSALELGDYTNISVNHGKYDRIIFHFKHFKIYRDIVKKYALNEYSLTHAHSLFSNGYIALKLKEKFGLPYIVAIRDTDVNTFFKYMVPLRGLGIQIINQAEKIIFLSKPYRIMVIEKFVPAKMRENVFNRTRIIPNGIDNFWLNNKPAKTKTVKNNTINIIFAGQVSRRKNVSTTIEACKILIGKGYNVNFTVVGSIKNKQEYQAIKAHDFITYIEHQPKEELMELYRKNNIFVMPSKTETFGLVYAEAMSQGLPVIYTKGQGFDGQFPEGEIGYSVAYNSPQDIADRILDVLANYEKLTINCIVKADKFNWDTISKEYIEIYSSLKNY